MGGDEHLPGSPWAGSGGTDPTIDWPAGWHVRHIAETASTNVDLLAVAERAPNRTVLVADHQTAGRGRLDRRWDAPPGANLLVSLLFAEVPGDPGELTRRVALAAATAAREVADVEVDLKWPNDLLVDGAKLAGILAQRSAAGPVVVGMGLNVGWAPDGAAKLGDEVTVTELLGALLRALDALPTDSAAISARYRERLGTLGRRVRIELVDGELIGTATDVDEHGRLLVLDECAITHRVDVGDVTHLRPA